MTVDELIKKYSAAQKTKKVYPFDKHIINRYIPYAEKMALTKSVVKTTSYIKVGEVEVYERNTPTMFFIFTMKLIEKYTDIEVDPSNIASDYDKLMSSGVMDHLMDVIPGSEVTILKGMLEMVRDDLEINTRSIVAFLETKSDAIKIAMDEMLNLLDNPDIKAKLARIAK